MLITGSKIRKIGIAVAVYKPDPQYLIEQLSSYLNQNFQNWFCVLTVDSDLEELKGLKLLAPYFSDERFLWFQNSSRLGPKKNFERAVRLAVEKGADAVACSDQDDIWYPEKLEVCAKVLEFEPGVCLVNSDMHILSRDESGGWSIGKETSWEVERVGFRNNRVYHLLVRNAVVGASILMDAELIRRHPKIPHYPPFHDHWYGILAAAYGRTKAIERPLYAYRQHGNNVLGATPYNGFFRLKERDRGRGLLEKCEMVFWQSFFSTHCSKIEGLNIPRWVTFIFLSRWDFGFGFYLLGLRHLFDDKPLARACFARAVGKLLSSFSSFPDPREKIFEGA
jgi:hypothetical protein